MRKCTKCKLEKEVSKFYFRKKGPQAGRPYFVCRNCMKTRGRNYYNSNIVRQRQLSLIRKRKYVNERINFVNSLKNKPCVDCDRIYPPWVMDYDHKEEYKKLSSISNIVRHKTWKFDKIKEEIRKCDLVCANCHRERTYRRLQKENNAAVAEVVKALV